MRRFRLTGPEVLVGGTNFERIANTILVRDGQVAVIADDDPRGDDLARSPYFEEIDDGGDPVKVDAAPEPVVEPSVDEGSEETASAETEGTTTRRRKTPADSGGV